MTRIIRSIAALAAIIFFAAFSLAVQPSPYSLYYLTMDASREPQVFRVSPDGSGPEQITHAQGGVRDFDIDSDGLSIAYINGGDLWLRALDESDPQRLARATGYPRFSQDGKYIVYADSYPRTVWLYNRSTRETRQLLADIDVENGYTHPDTFRKFTPDQFVLEDSGRATALIIRIAGWGWKSIGVYDLENGELQELVSTPHTCALPLSDGRLLFYGDVFESPTERAVLHIADDSTRINDARELFSADTLTGSFVSIDAAVELRPGVARISGVTADPSHPFVGGSVYYLDIDLATGAARDLRLVGTARTGGVIVDTLSPDGRFAPLHLNPTMTSTGVLYEGFELLNLETGKTVGEFPANVYNLRWRQ